MCTLCLFISRSNIIGLIFKQGRVLYFDTLMDLIFFWFVSCILLRQMDCSNMSLSSPLIFFFPSGFSKAAALQFSHCKCMWGKAVFCATWIVTADDQSFNKITGKEFLRIWNTKYFRSPIFFFFPSMTVCFSLRGLFTDRRLLHFHITTEKLTAKKKK